MKKLMRQYAWPIVFLVTLLFWTLVSWLEAPPVTGPYRDKHAVAAIEDSTLDSVRVANASDTTRVLPGSIQSASIKPKLTFYLPLWNNRPMAGPGEIGLDTTGTDTVWIYTQDGWYSLAP